MADLSSSVAELSKSFSGRLLLPKDSDWDTARRVHNGLVDKRPALIAQCLGAADITAAVRLAREHSLEIAVRGGGHNVSGRATVDGGLMIDLSALKYVHADPKARTARAGGGTLWGHFNRETQAHGLATTGGVVSTTGVAGLTLGGGIGWLMPKFGMALDNLLGVEIVLADGHIVRAADDENPDLFWAVRGGGGNFGVVSSLEFRLHEVGPLVTGGIVAWPAKRARETLRLFRDFAERATDEVMLVAALMTAPDGATKVSAIAAGYFGPSAIAERVVKPIKVFDQPVVDTLGPIPYEQLNASLDASFPRGARNYWKSHFCEQLTDEAIETIIDCHRKCPSPMAMASIEHFTVRPHASRPRRPHLRCAGADSTSWRCRNGALPPVTRQGSAGHARRMRRSNLRRVESIRQLPRPGRRRRCRPRRGVWTECPAATVDQGQVRPGQRIPPQREHSAEGVAQPAVVEASSLAAAAATSLLSTVRAGSGEK